VDALTSSGRSPPEAGHACREPAGDWTAASVAEVVPPDPVLLDEALAFYEIYREECRLPERVWRRRVEQVIGEIAETGTYTHAADELAFGAKLAWRNHTRCIGKLYWRTLLVRDCRQQWSPAEIRESLVEQLRLAANGGRIRPVVSVFPPSRPGRPGPRILSTQLVRYAGYRQPDGSVVGDPANVWLTERAISLGWRGEGGRFDRLPILLNLPGTGPQLVELPADLVPDVVIRHPRLPRFEALGLRWYSFPTVSDMRLEVGGICYPAAPFSGWYVSTEIGARNFGDTGRYDTLRAVAESMGLDTSSDRTLWKDRALVELNVAIITSFEQAGVKLADHHTMAQQFHRYTQAERRAGRTVHADWAWIIPPMSASATPVYHQQYDSTVLRPNFFRDPRPV
jgi:nitric-oxide synthase